MAGNGEVLCNDKNKCSCCERGNIRVVNTLWQSRIPFTTIFQSDYSPTTENYFTWLKQLIECLHLPCTILCETKVFTGRPCMLQWKWKCHHLNCQRYNTILFFPNRAIQFLGSMTDNDVYHLYQHCQHLFSMSTTYCLQHLPFPRLKTMTIVYPLQSVHYEMNNIRSIFNSSHNKCIYETELFPGVQLSYWLPIHVVLFHTGNVTISGVKAFCQVDSIIHDFITNKYFPLFKKK